MHTGTLALTSEQMHTLDHVRMRMINGYFKPYKRQRRGGKERRGVRRGGEEGTVEVQVLSVLALLHFALMMTGAFSWKRQQLFSERLLAH